MNHVNLIGKISSAPKVLELENGRKIAQFSLSTSEVYLDGDGNKKERKHWHRISAWGKWVSVLEKFGEKGLKLAIEGRLVSRFYKGKTGDRRFVVEVEVNDLILM
jgi:single-strand DNA-binding protein